MFIICDLGLMFQQLSVEKRLYSLMKIKRLKHFRNAIQLILLFFGVYIIISFVQYESMADVYQYIDNQQVIHLTNVSAGPNYRLLIKEQPSNNYFEPDVGPFYDLISWSAERYGVDSNLVKAIIKTESNFNHKAVSKKGAKGLMQLMPKTAVNFGVNDCFHPESNIDGGIRYLSYLIRLYNGNLPLSLAAYNAGEGAVAKYRGIPPYPETRSYVRQVLNRYDEYKQSAKHKSLAASASRN